MSSLHNDLDTWANKARTRGFDTIEISNDTAHEIAKQLRKLAAVSDALDMALTGSNHLASQLISRLGARFSDEYPVDMSAETALSRLHATVEYDIWCAWSSLMRARDRAEWSA